MTMVNKDFSPRIFPDLFIYKSSVLKIGLFCCNQSKIIVLKILSNRPGPWCPDTRRIEASLASLSDCSRLKGGKLFEGSLVASCLAHVKRSIKRRRAPGGGETPDLSALKAKVLR